MDKDKKLTFIFGAAAAGFYAAAIAMIAGNNPHATFMNLGIAMAFSALAHDKFSISREKGNFQNSPNHSKQFHDIINRLMTHDIQAKRKITDTSETSCQIFYNIPSGDMRGDGYELKIRCAVDAIWDDNLPFAKKHEALRTKINGYETAEFLRMGIVMYLRNNELDPHLVGLSDHDIDFIGYHEPQGPRIPKAELPKFTDHYRF